MSDRQNCTNETVHTATGGPDDTRALGRALAAILTDGDVVVLTGDLGAGKTCLTQGMGVGLGIDDRITSPTFTLAAVYHGTILLNHLDVYRLDGASDAIDLDLPDLLENGVTVIEWGERIDEALPDDRLVIDLRYPPEGADDDRLIDLRPFGRWAQRVETLQSVLEPWIVKC